MEPLGDVRNKHRAPGTCYSSEAGLAVRGGHAEKQPTNQHAACCCTNLITVV